MIILFETNLCISFVLVLTKLLMVIVLQSWLYLVLNNNFLSWGAYKVRALMIHKLQIHFLNSPNDISDSMSLPLDLDKFWALIPFALPPHFAIFRSLVLISRSEWIFVPPITGGKSRQSWFTATDRWLFPSLPHLPPNLRSSLVVATNLPNESQHLVTH